MNRKVRGFAEKVKQNTVYADIKSINTRLVVGQICENGSFGRIWIVNKVSLGR